MAVCFIFIKTPSLPDIFKYIRDYYRHAFNWLYFALILAMIATLIYLNYWHFLEIKLVNFGHSGWTRFAGYYLLYFTPFVVAFLLQGLFFKGCDHFRSPWFWAILLLAPAFFSFRVNFDQQESWVKSIWSGDEQVYYTHCFNWVVRVGVVMTPVGIIWFLKDRGNQPFYGTRPLHNLKPYLLMLAIMIPLIALASTQKDFLSMYPRARFIAQLDLPATNWRYFFYELCYGFDFVSIEFFFRGFLILSLARICGPHCIVPMACFYCTIHFGKPLGEAISSFWGGLLLGIVSFNTGSVWGGLLVHLGIAWFMEAGGWLGSLIKK